MNKIRFKKLTSEKLICKCFKENLSLNCTIYITQFNNVLKRFLKFE